MRTAIGSADGASLSFASASREPCEVSWHGCVRPSRLPHRPTTPILGDRQNRHMDLDAVATELYGLAPADFTNIRDARASEAKSAGDRELARAIGKLRRPSVSAWLANVLVRERHDQVQSMLDLGAAIRQAQAQSAIDELRKLQRERRRAIASLLDDAAVLARDRGESFSGAVAPDLEATLEAALLDPEAATALKTGLLTTGLRYAGLGWSGATDDPSLSADTSEPATMVGRAKKSDPGLPPADQALRLAAAEAQRETEAHLAEAEREAEAGKARVEEAARDRDVWRRKVADLEQQLDCAQEEAQKAEHRFADAEEALALAEQRLRAARVRLDKNSGLSG
jgi:hypothetical protein